MPRGRPAIAVDGNKLQTVITLLEEKNNFSNRSALWQAVSNDDWAKSIGLSAQMAMLKAKAFQLTIGTPVGRRGRLPGSPAVSVNRPRKHKVLPKEEADKLKVIFGPTLESKVNRAVGGSRKAAIALKCIDCCAGQKKEVSLCTITTCPLWAFRPYRHKKSLTAEGRKAIIDGSFQLAKEQE